MTMMVLALTRYDDLAASTRQRFKLYEPALTAAGIQVDYAPLLSNRHVRGLVAGRRASVPDTARAYLARLWTLAAAARRYDVLWVHCELFPYLPGLPERLVFLWRKPVVFDYDDAIFHYYDAAKRPLVRWLLGRKLEPLLSGAAACLCGNAYLRDYAARFCARSIIVPTVVDTNAYRPAPRTKRAGPPVIGWIGSPTTWANVRPLLPMLEQLHREHGVRIRAIGAGVEADRDRFSGLDLVEWSEAREIAEVQAIDIGVMPLLDRPFEHGKSGYKLIQYMACGLPVVASPVGVNSEIVRPGENGLLASSEEEWREALTRLIGDPPLRERLGKAGRDLAERSYSLASQAPRLVELFRSVADSR
jgi:glycosyltransferase involved in cell wall biosynthesis